MNHRLDNHNPAQPSVDEIPRIKGNMEESNQWVVPASHEHKRNQVDSSHCARTIPDHAAEGLFILPVRKGDHAEHSVHRDDSKDDESMKAAGQIAHIDSSRQLEFAVVPNSKQRSIDQVVLDLSKRLICRREVPLLSIVEARQTPEMPGEAKSQLPDIHESGHAAEDQERDACQVIVEHLVEYVTFVRPAIAFS